MHSYGNDGCLSQHQKLNQETPELKANRIQSLNSDLQIHVLFIKADTYTPACEKHSFGIITFLLCLLKKSDILPLGHFLAKYLCHPSSP